MTDVADLIVPQTQAEIFASALAHAETNGLVVSSWREGDPTLTEYDALAEILAAREEITVEYIKAGFLSLAEEDWLTVLALEVFGVTREPAVYATSTVSLSNTGGGVYSREPGEITVKNTTTGKTYTSTSAVSLSGVGDTTTVDVVANDPGTDSSAATDEIDDLVTTMLGVVVTGSTAAIGVDVESDPSLKQRCADTLGALSPNGPADAYSSVARNSALTGSTEVNRVLAVPDSVYGTVDVLVAGTTGNVSAGAITAVQTAIDLWATPLCITATVANADEHTLNVTLTASGSNIPADLETAVEDVLGVLVFALPIEGVVTTALLIATVHAELIRLGASNVSIALTVPAADVDLDGTGEVFVLGTVSATEV